jgi:superfamily II DNA/RNA helicase
MDIEKDIALLEGIRDNWFKRGEISHDPKLDHFATVAGDMLRKEPLRKLVVYTSYADTANYLYDRLKDSLRVFKYTGSDATRENKRIIKENFDAGWPEQKDDSDILIATDAISDGYNLHRAGAIFNYDIPYNPTRVIQRVGRINRINKKVFDQLYIYNFFPSEIGEREMEAKSISTLKEVGGKHSPRRPYTYLMGALRLAHEINQKLLEIQKIFLEAVFGHRRQFNLIIMLKAFSFFTNQLNETVSIPLSHQKGKVDRLVY